MKSYINKIRRAVFHNLTQFVGASYSLKDKPYDLNSKPIRILISRPNSRLGNLLLLTPLLQEVQKSLPLAKIDVFVRGGLGDVLYKNYNNVERVIALPSKPFKQLLKYILVWYNLRKYHYDLVINTIPRSSSGRLSTKLVKAELKFFGENNESLKKQITDYCHMAKLPVYNYRNYLQRVGYTIDLTQYVSTLSLMLTKDEITNGRNKLNQLIENKKETICIYTFATGRKCFNKVWWCDLYSKLKEHLGDQYNLMEVLPKERVSQIDFKAISYYSTDIREMAAVISHTKLFITADCGVMHLSSASNTPTLGLFSVTPIEVYQPYNSSSRSLNVLEADQNEILTNIHEMLSEIKTLK